MLSDKEIAALKNGAYGVSRKGLKCKYVGEVAQERGQYYFAYFNKLNKVIHIAVLDRNLEGLLNHTEGCDVVGLWVDKLEPFNVERALLGEPVMTRDRAKAYVQTHITQPKELKHYCLIGFGYNGEHKEFLHWDETGRVMADDDTCDDIIGMWKQPQEQPVLPKPITDFGDLGKVWYIGLDAQGNSYIPMQSIKEVEWAAYQKERLKNGFYYATKEDCQRAIDTITGKETSKNTLYDRVHSGTEEDILAWFDAMEKNRR